MSDLIERIKKRIEEDKGHPQDYFDDEYVICVECINKIIDEESAKEQQEEPKCSECVRESIQVECVLDGCKFHAKEPQECEWVKGINIIETCWGDLPAKRIGKKYGWRYCPFCGKEIRWSNEHK